MNGMTTNRAHAYGRVMTLLTELGPAKLHAPEQQAIRDAADALLFCSDIDSDPDTRAALDAFMGVAARLVLTERLLQETADRLIDAVEGCGPKTDRLLLPVPLAA
jgi:hypothetical protein